MRLIDTIKSPDDVKKLNKVELETLCFEIRNCILSARLGIEKGDFKWKIMNIQI